ncbi:hypothetical protein J3R30DRAFT_3294835 [Lentinula aciculospora]|uniref:Uncharacterized protein n=1 Tax=Lentinula aciculospora TaxID=153920 RepID=A0A9W9A5P5_9AGAR|nr:hypothetical protein J3R30DRAFT_3294835 [Lentinula aciculospora]
MTVLSRNPLKRKTPPVDAIRAETNGATAVVLDDDGGGSADGDADEQDDIRDVPYSTRSPPPFPGRPGEYEAGRIDCPSCHKQIAFRDEETGEFSLKRWQQHWESCRQRSPRNINVYRSGPDDLFPALMAHPPTKRRRAKRTEEERIAYLRADPYVARFEAYRVLCASCDKWIRLRPNSTYCSIPWDAHRKSCLSKKISNKNTYALDERNSLFTKDPDVRKFDAERVLCAVCDKWISINPEDHLQAVQTWLNHRGECAKRAAAVAGVSGSGPSMGSVAPSLHASAPSIEGGFQHEPIMYAPAAGIFPPGPAHESRRRNAEQRAATLRADSLITHVEPNRVFCSLCEKWVQLRQDSSFCAYPWYQHRGKCLARYQRRAQKAAEIEEIKKKRAGGPRRRLIRGSHPHHDEEDELAYFSGSDQGRSDEDEEMNMRFDYHELSASASPARSGSVGSIPSADEGQGSEHMLEQAEYERAKARRVHSQQQNESAEPDANPEVDCIDARCNEETPTESNGDKFVSHSIAYLFQTTYDCSLNSSDELSISALVAYLNAAMPIDKHEDFDTAEVVRCVGALREKGKILLEGDVVRKVRRI